MKFLIYISILTLFSCSYPVKKTDTQEMYSISENFVLFLKDNDHFDIYFETDTVSFFLEADNEKINEYTYDIYSVKDTVKSGRFIYEVDFSDSDSLSLYIDCTNLSLPQKACNKWIYFVKGSQSNLYYEKYEN